MAFTDLPPSAQAEAIDGFCADFLTVARHVIADTDAYPNTHTMTALLAAFEHHECPSLETLNTVVGWVLFTLRWHADVRALTADELAVNAAAERLSDAIHFKGASREI